MQNPKGDRSGSDASGTKAVGIILARGGSKGIPKKNIVDFCGKPLMAWTITQMLESGAVDSIWVSSDSREILDVGERYGAQPMERPAELSNDVSSSEVAWLHSIEYLEKKGIDINLIVAPQVTSPLRDPGDFRRAITQFRDEGYDSMFSCSPAEDLCLWERTDEGDLRSVNYDYLNRKRRQDFAEQFIENGSFYLFKPDILRRYNNRFGGRIGMFKMEFWKIFEIDSWSHLKLCAAVMNAFILDRKPSE